MLVSDVGIYMDYCLLKAVFFSRSLIIHMLLSLQRLLLLSSKPPCRECGMYIFIGFFFCMIE